MARRMKQQKEYYWQGKGGPDVTLEEIISELLGRDFDKTTENPALGEMTDVYTLQFDFYNDDNAYEGHSIIHVPHNKDYQIVFKMIVLSSDGTTIEIDGMTIMDDSLIGSITTTEFAIYLRKIASNQPYKLDYS